VLADVDVQAYPTVLNLSLQSGHTLGFDGGWTETFETLYPSVWGLSLVARVPLSDIMI
jgi:hypothetical protein